MRICLKKIMTFLKWNATKHQLLIEPRFQKMHGLIFETITGHRRNYSVITSDDCTRSIQLNESDILMHSSKPYPVPLNLTNIRHDVITGGLKTVIMSFYDSNVGVI